VLRGGNWNNNWNNLRVANRNNNNPENRNNNIGFRCAGGVPGAFLKGQVPCIHGCRRIPWNWASAARENSRPVPGQTCGLTEDEPGRRGVVIQKRMKLRADPQVGRCQY